MKARESKILDFVIGFTRFVHLLESETYLLIPRDHNHFETRLCPHLPADERKRCGFCPFYCFHKCKEPSDEISFSATRQPIL
jgi:hypothetical protein